MASSLRRNADFLRRHDSVVTAWGLCRYGVGKNPLRRGEMASRRRHRQAQSHRRIKKQRMFARKENIAYFCIAKQKIMAKHLYIIAGCNGAGKTTASMTILPRSLLVKEFVNADEIAKGLSPFNPEGVAIEAGRLMLERIQQLLDKGESFSIETTLATRSYVNLVRNAQQYGYIVHIIFFWLNSPQLAVDVWLKE